MKITRKFSPYIKNNNRQVILARVKKRNLFTLNFAFEREGTDCKISVGEVFGRKGCLKGQKM